MTAHPQFISADAVVAALTWPDIIAALREAYAGPQDRNSSPRRIVAHTPTNSLRILAATPPGKRFMGAKIFGFSKRGGAYAILLFDQESGDIAGLLDANHITRFRTGATTAVALDCLVPRRSVTVAMLGSGKEAQAHLAAFSHVRNIASFRVFSPSEAHRLAFVEQFKQEFGLSGKAVDDARSAVEGADVVIAAARSRGERPILFGDWLKPGMAIASIGSTVPEQREVDVSVVGACDLIVCDQVDEVVEETGDMIAAREAGLSFETKLAALSDLVPGRCADRLRHTRLPMVKTTGAAIQDLAVAELAFTRAVARGLSQELPSGFLYKAL